MNLTQLLWKCPSIIRSRNSSYMCVFMLRNCCWTRPENKTAGTWISRTNVNITLTNSSDQGSNVLCRFCVISSFKVCLTWVEIRPPTANSSEMDYKCDSDQMYCVIHWWCVCLCITHTFSQRSSSELNCFYLMPQEQELLQSHFPPPPPTLATRIFFTSISVLLKHYLVFVCGLFQKVYV